MRWRLQPHPPVVSGFSRTPGLPPRPRAEPTPAPPHRERRPRVDRDPLPRPVAGESGEVLREQLLRRVVEAPRSGRLVALLGNVHDDVQHDRIDGRDHDPVLAPERRDGCLRDPALRLRPGELAVDGEGADSPHQVGRQALLEQMRGTQPLHRPAVVQRRAADRAEQVVAARARRQRDDDVSRVDDIARGARQASGIEEAEQQVAHLGVRLLDLVDEQDRDGLLEGGEERRRRCMAGVAGRRAEQPRDLDRVRQLRAVEPEDGGALEAERRERGRERLDGARLADARRAGKQHRAGPGRMPLASAARP